MPIACISEEDIAAITRMNKSQKDPTKNKIEIIINFSEITKFNENKKIKAKVLAKLMQNIKTCRKSKCKLKIASFASTKEELADDYQRKSFMLSLGADTKTASESVELN